MTKYYSLKLHNSLLQPNKIRELIYKNKICVSRIGTIANEAVPLI